MRGRLQNGEWIPHRDAVSDDLSDIIREPAVYRGRVAKDPATRAPDPHRYHLFVSHACPWAHRVLLVRTLKGLEEAIGISVTDSHADEDGWAFRGPRGERAFDAETGVRCLRDLYLIADPNYTGPVSLPVLWDRYEHTIVNGDAVDIMRMLDVDFHPLARRKVSLYPERLADGIDRTIAAVDGPVTEGVYRCGLARDQRSYARAFEELFDALMHWDSVLGTQRYVCGDALTAADVCFFVSLVRFDAVYFSHFKCNWRRIEEFPNLSAYVRELYQLPTVAETCRFDQIKRHYYTSYPSLNPSGLVPCGPNLGWLDEPHDRLRLAGGPPPALRFAA